MSMKSEKGIIDVILASTVLTVVASAVGVEMASRIILENLTN